MRKREDPEQRSLPSAMIAIRSPSKSASSLQPTKTRTYEKLTLCGEGEEKGQKEREVGEKRTERERGGGKKERKGERRKGESHMK